MKIFFDATVMQFYHTGVSKSTLFLYQAVKQIAPEINVVGIHQKKIKGEKTPSFEWKRIGQFYPSSYWREKYLPSIVRKEKPDFLHFPWSGNIPSKKMDTKIIMTLHDVLPLEIPGYFKNDQERNNYIFQKQNDIDKTDILFTVSFYSQKQILQHFKTKTPPIVLHSGPTIKKTTTQEKINFSYFLYVGGYDKRKGIDKLVKIFITLHQQKKTKVKLVLVGDPYYFSEDFKKDILQAQKLGFLIQTGYITDEKLALFFQNALALVYPSQYEGFGLPPLEAMSLGCPVITTNKTSLPEICGDAVYYIDPNNFENFSTAILELENNPHLRNQLREKGLQQASFFSWEKTAEKFLEQIRKKL